MNEKRPAAAGREDETPPAANKLSHEIRSTAQGLLGYLLIFTDEVKPQLSAEQAHVLDRINFFAKKLADLLLDFLAETQPPRT